jgi:prophage regulatory protein
MAHQFLRLSEVVERCAVSRSFLYASVANGTFPKPVKLGMRSVWVRAEIDEWVKTKVSKRAEDEAAQGKASSPVRAVKKVKVAEAIPLAKAAAKSVEQTELDAAADVFHWEAERKLRLERSLQAICDDAGLLEEQAGGPLRLEAWREAVEEARAQLEEAEDIDSLNEGDRNTEALVQGIVKSAIIVARAVVLAANLLMRPR